MLTVLGTPPRRVEYTLRWWQTTAIAFAWMTPIATWILVITALLAHLATLGNIRAYPFWFVIPAQFVLTFVIAATKASNRERRRPPEAGPSGARRTKGIIVILLCVVFAFLTSPAGLVLLADYGISASAQEQARWELRMRSPIVAGPQVGFCAPPVCGSSGGLPVVEVTARLPRRGRYLWYAIAYDSTRKELAAELDTTFSKGVTTVRLRLQPTRTPVRGSEGVAWPVRVKTLAIKAGSPRSRRLLDCRRGPIATIPAPPGGQRSPAAR